MGFHGLDRRIVTFHFLKIKKIKSNVELCKIGGGISRIRS
jgi:hypothetical protein